jgi:hypothetical protein
MNCEIKREFFFFSLLLLFSNIEMNSKLFGQGGNAVVPAQQYQIDQKA